MTVGGTKRITIGGSSEGVGRGRTLTTVYSDESESHPLTTSNGAFVWLGNTVIRNKRLHAEVHVGSPLVFGEPGCETTVSVEGLGGNGVCGMYVRNNGTLRFYSRVDMGDTGLWQTDANGIYFHAPGNRWNGLQILVGTVYCCTNNALAPSAVRMGQTYESYSFNPVLDLGGFDQTIAGLVINPSISNSSETVRSSKPATLTISNDVDTTTLRMQCAIKGAITLRKAGSGTWSFGASNQTTGNVEVVGGTLKLTSSDTLPAGENSLLSIESGAQIVLDEGVAASIAYATCGGRPLKAGTYCGDGGTGTRLDAYIGAGAGTLTVTRGVNGLALIFR